MGVMIANAAEHPELAATMADRCAKLGLDSAATWPLGFHGDGVPFAAKMRDRLECISFNIFTEVHGVSLLFTTFPKSHSAGKKAWDALFKVFAWSVRHLMFGIFPTVREDAQSDRTTSGRQPPSVPPA
jgi:hypothetical protein